MVDKSLLATAGVDRHPMDLFVHDLAKGRASRNLGQNLFHLTAVNQRFAAPDPNQAQILEASSKRVVPFDNAAAFLFLTDMNLNRKNGKIEQRNRDGKGNGGKL